MVPILLPLQPSQSSPSSETCQLISYRSKGLADNHCHAALFLHRSWMHGSSSGGDLCTRAGHLQGKIFSLQRKRWDLVPEMCTVYAADALSWLAFQPCPADTLRKGCASPGSATDHCCPRFFPQSWISAGCRRTRAPAGPLC